MTALLPLLPTSVVGSHALPGWRVLGREAQAAGRLGPVDRRELIVLDQIEVGAGLPVNGEGAGSLHAGLWRPAAIAPARRVVS